MMEEKKTEQKINVVLGKRTHKSRGDSSDKQSDSDDDDKKKKKSKKHKKDKKDKKHKKDKKASKRAKHDDVGEFDDERDKGREERWVLPERNPWTGRSWSDKFYEILTKRKDLPAWQARQQVLDLVNEY